MYRNRISLYKDFEKTFNSKLLVYITSDRRGFETQIAGDVIDIFVNQLDRIGVVPKISLYLYTRGGETAAAWNIINLLKLYCAELEVIVPRKAHSAGTLICIGANSIVMTKEATLGPIDPSINTFLNPPIPGAPPQNTFPVSVEAVKGYLAYAKEELSITDDIALSNIMIKLSDSVHPLVLGQAYRLRTQIKMLAEKLLVNQVTDPAKIQQIIAFLCSDSGSHDYTINRREAKNSLGLNVVEPDPEMYRVIKKIYDDINEELGFGLPFDLRAAAYSDSGEYSIKRGLIESIPGGSDFFVTHGRAKLIQLHPNQIIMQPMGIPQEGIQDERVFEGWRHEPPIIFS